MHDRTYHSSRDNGSCRDGCGGRYRVIAAAVIVITSPVVVIVHVDVHVAVHIDILVYVRVPIHIRVVIDIRLRAATNISTTLSEQLGFGRQKGDYKENGNKAISLHGSPLLVAFTSPGFDFSYRDAPGVWAWNEGEGIFAERGRQVPGQGFAVLRLRIIVESADDEFAGQRKFA